MSWPSRKEGQLHIQPLYLCKKASKPGIFARCSLMAPDYDMADELHWRGLFLCLPPEGVSVRFPTVEACRDRLVAVRWPEGVRCLRCWKRNPLCLTSRNIYQCRACRFQFSATTGSTLHRSRIALDIWFAAAERIISYRHKYGGLDPIGGHQLAREVGVAYVAARRLRSIIIDDLKPGGVGLLGSAVCGESYSLR